MHHHILRMVDYRIIFFVLSLLVAVPVLVYYYRRHPHPRFRPKLGEMAMVSLFALLLCTAGSIVLGGLMQDPDQLRAGAEMGMAPEGHRTPKNPADPASLHEDGGKKKESSRSGRGDDGRSERSGSRGRD